MSPPLSPSDPLATEDLSLFSEDQIATLRAAQTVNWAELLKFSDNDGLVQHGPLRVPPDHPGLPGNRARIYSPCTGIVVRDYDPRTGVTTKTVCEVARLFITSRDLYFPPHSSIDPYFERGVGDPVYFIAAGVDFRSLTVPYYGTVAYADEGVMKRFLKRFGREVIDGWEWETGVPFPYRRFPGRARQRRADNAAQGEYEVAGE